MIDFIPVPVIKSECIYPKSTERKKSMEEFEFRQLEEICSAMPQDVWAAVCFIIKHQTFIDRIMTADRMTDAELEQWLQRAREAHAPLIADLALYKQIKDQTGT
jgi:Tfp pilus assembly protein PilP